MVDFVGVGVMVRVVVVRGVSFFGEGKGGLKGVDVVAWSLRGASRACGVCVGVCVRVFV